MQIFLSRRWFINLLLTAMLGLGTAWAADPAPKPAIKADGTALLEVWVPPAVPPGLAKEPLPSRLTVRIIVDAAGKVTAARALESTDPRFDEAALAAIKAWVFKPAIIDGEPVASCLDVPVDFSARKKMKPGTIPPVELLPVAQTASPEPLSSPSGDYPTVLSERKLPGIVRFSCIVTAEGRARNPHIRGATHADFVLPALEALKQWTFTPAMEGDLAVKAELEAQVTFDVIGEVRRVDLLAVNGLTTPEGTPPEDAPGLLAMADPVWPLDPLLAGEGGAATVEFTVGTQGQVHGAKVLDASQPAFGRALLAAAESWEFQPAIKDGAAVEVVLVKKWTFTAVPKELPADADALAKLVGDLRVAGRIGSARGLDHPLEPLYRVPPVYPQGLRDGERPAGQAMIEFVVDRDGRARLPRIISATQEEFGWAAAHAAAQWVFKPATRAGEPVAVKIRVPFEFAPPAE